VKESGKYYIVDVLREKNRPGQTERAPGQKANTSDINYTTGDYSVIDHAAAVLVPDEIQTNSDTAIKPFADATELAMTKVFNGKEIDAAAILTAGLATQALQNGDWDQNGSDPITDVVLASNTILDSVQKKANTFACSQAIFNHLRKNPTIKEVVKYGGTSENPAVLTLSAIAQVFGVDRVVVSAAYTNAADIESAASQSEIWSKDAYLAYVPPRPGLQTMATGYTFAWNAGPGFVNGRATERWRVQDRKSDMVGTYYYYDQVLIESGAAIRFVNVIS
jgi:hypothetical protein